MKMKTLSIFMLLALFVGSVNAAEQDAAVTKITRMYIYTQYGNGDVQILVSSPAPNCSQGFWLSPADPAYKATLSLLLSAYHSGSNLHMVGEDTQIWPGSSQVFCRLIAAGLI